MAAAEITCDPQDDHEGSRAGSNSRQVVGSLVLCFANAAETSASKDRPVRSFNFLAAVAAEVGSIEHGMRVSA